MVCPQNLASCSPSESPAGEGDVRLFFSTSHLLPTILLLGVNLTEAELEVVQSAGLVALYVQVLYHHHNGGIYMLRILNQPFTVQVAAVIGHKVTRGGEVPSSRVAQGPSTLYVKGRMQKRHWRVSRRE